MDNLRRLGNRISIPIPTDDEGMTGRECPEAKCEGYFKVQFGTGLTGPNLPCHCPYCGHTAGHDHFWTKEQLTYAESMVVQRMTDALVRDLKQLEFAHKPHGSIGIGIGIGISMKLKPGAPVPIRHYREKTLETTLVCDACTLRYAVYGAFAFCPDCGSHNSQQILRKNLELARQELQLAESQDADLQRHLVEDVLENAVSAFDGFGREAVRIRASLARRDSGAAQVMSFQRLTKADDRLFDLFGFRISTTISAADWAFALRAFQKRHVLAHRMGVVDEQYVRETSDPDAVVGRRIPVGREEVHRLLEIVEAMGAALLGSLPTTKGTLTSSWSAHRDSHHHETTEL